MINNLWVEFYFCICVLIRNLNANAIKETTLQSTLKSIQKLSYKFEILPTVCSRANDEAHKGSIGLKEFQRKFRKFHSQLRAIVQLRTIVQITVLLVNPTIVLCKITKIFGVQENNLSLKSRSGTSKKNIKKRTELEYANNYGVRDSTQGPNDVVLE